MPDLRTSILTLLHSTGPLATTAGLASVELKLLPLGVTLQRNSAGEIRGRLYTPGGGVVDVVPSDGWGHPWVYVVREAGTDVPTPDPEPTPETGCQCQWSELVSRLDALGDQVYELAAAQAAAAEQTLAALAAIRALRWQGDAKILGFKTTFVLAPKSVQ